MVQNRLIVSENLTTPLLLLSILATWRYLAGIWPRWRFAAVAVAATAAATLCKVVAGAQAASIAVLLIAAGRPRDLVFPVAGAACGVVAYAAYGAVIDWEWFRAVQANQAQRFSGLNPLATLLVHQPMTPVSHFSHLVLSGWITLILHQFSRRVSPVLLAAAPYLLGHMFFVQMSMFFGWHVLPYLPFLCLSMVWLVREVVAVPRPATWYGFLLLVLPGAADLVWQVYVEEKNAVRYGYLIFVTGCFMAPLASRRFFARSVRYATLAILLFLVIREVRITWLLSLRN